MPITTDKNTNYGPPLVNQKYAPLRDIIFAGGNRAVHTALITNRARNLRAANRLGRPLTLATSSWANCVAAENQLGQLPPLVVISSNRSAWIAAGVQAAQTQLDRLGLEEFPNASDLRALIPEENASTQSPPIYIPKRTGGHRSVYVVVQINEYMTYKTAFANLGITPVGYWFSTSGGGPRSLSLVGFGASRFAAMEFCKVLRREAEAAAPGNTPPWNYAWLVDDNVVALTNFAGYTKVEEAMSEEVVCAGFRGGTKAEARSVNRLWAKKEIDEGRGEEPEDLPENQPPGIMQQMSLWNVEYLDQNQLNFGPIYITSAEDLSITNYFNIKGITYRYYKGIGIRKEDTTYDNGAGAQRVGSYRQSIARWVADLEAEPTPRGGTAPPPTVITPAKRVDGGDQNLSTFVVSRVLPNAGAMREQATNTNTQNTAKCQAVEQIVCGAINKGFVADQGYLDSFKINGDDNQVVNRVDL